ncbi:MAG: monovalent cation/H+ antiporter complex subunit F [Kiritimatiellia bacterium]|nr:sodium:proton antiporter [Lentisphaerota bacterium]
MIAVVAALLLFACGCFYRVVRGPTLLDRVAAVDAIGVLLTVVLVLSAHIFGRVIFLDIAMVYALLMFADMLILAKFIETGGVS